jgi:hypothetical protein
MVTTFADWLSETERSAGWKGANGIGRTQGTGVLRCAQDDSQKQTTAKTDNGKGKSRSPAGMTTKGGKGKNRTGDNKGKSRSLAGMTTKGTLFRGR